MEEIARLGKLYDLAFCPDGGRLVAIRGASDVVLVDVATAEVVSSMRFRYGSSVAVARDGSRIVAVNTSGGGMILDGESFQERARTSGRGIGEGPGAVFGPDACYVQASWNGDVIVRHLTTGEIVYRERQRGHIVNALASTPAGTLFAYSVSSNVREDHAVLVRRWPFDANAPEALVELKGPGRAADAVAVRDDGLVALIADCSIRIYSSGGGDCLAERAWQFPGTDYALAWSPDGGDLAVIERGADELTNVSVLDADALTESDRASVPYACSLAYSPDGSLLAIGSWESGRIMRR